MTCPFAGEEVNMRRHLFTIVLFLITALVAGLCKASPRDITPPNGAFQEIHAAQKSATVRTIERFRRIERRMSMKDVIKLCGQPDRDIGSGIHIYVYQLIDGSEVRVGTPDDKKIIYVIHVMPDGDQSDLLRSE